MQDSFELELKGQVTFSLSNVSAVFVTGQSPETRNGGKPEGGPAGMPGGGPPGMPGGGPAGMPGGGPSACLLRIIDIDCVDIDKTTTTATAATLSFGILFHN